MATISGLTVALLAEKCIGPIDVNGDAKYDMEAAMNLHEMCVAINALLMDVQRITHNITSDYPGAQVLGGRSVSYLAELRDRIDGWLKEVQDQQMQKRSEGDDGV